MKHNKMKKFTAAGLLGLSLAISNVFAADMDVVATVNDVAITKDKLDTLVDAMQRANPSGQADTRGILNDLIDTEVVRQEANKSGLTERDDIKKKLEDLRDRLVLSAWTQEKIKTLEISDDDLKAAYDKRMENQPKHEYNARHILVKTEDEAKAVIKELEGGTDFAELAKTKSTGPSGPNGGSLNWFKAHSMVPPFAEAVKKMEKGSITKEPVKTDFGWHVIKLEDKRDVKLPDLEKIKPQLRKIVEQEKLQDYVRGLREKAKVEIKLPEEKKEQKQEAAPAAEEKPAEK